MSTWLEWREGGQVRRQPVTGRITVGRAPGNTILIHDERLSREHCVIVPRAAGVAVDASRSQNGVIVGGRRSRRAEVPVGGAFQLGSTVFRIVAAAPPMSSVAARPATAAAPQPVRRSTAPALLVAGVAVAGFALVGAVVAALQLNGDSHADSGGSLARALERRDTGGIITSLGGDADVPEAREAVDALLAGLPPGTTMRQIEHGGDSDYVRYELTVPGGEPREVAFVQVRFADGRTILLPAAESP